MVDKRSVQIDTTRIYYQQYGSGAPIVLLHGLSGSSRWWKYNVAVLAENHQVFVVDLIGFGHSRGQRFVLHEAAQCLDRWMEEIGIECTSVIGHSMGGWIAADLAAAHPRRVDRLVLVDAVALPLRRSYLRHGVGLVQAMLEMPLNFLPVLVLDALRAGPITLMKAARELLTTDISRKLQHIDAPTLVVWGEHDWLVPLQVGQRLYDLLPNAHLCVIPRAGHNPMWDQPAAFNQVVQCFLTGQTAEAPRERADQQGQSRQLGQQSSQTMTNG